MYWSIICPVFLSPLMFLSSFLALFLSCFWIRDGCLVISDPVVFALPFTDNFSLMTCCLELSPLPLWGGLPAGISSYPPQCDTEVLCLRTDQYSVAPEKCLMLIMFLNILLWHICTHVIYLIWHVNSFFWMNSYDCSYYYYTMLCF